MAERVQFAAKTSEAKRENSASKIRKTESPQVISSPADQFLYLQRTIGNQAVQRLIKSGTLQAKLKIGQPGDKYEQEADRVADAVMRMPEPGVQRQVEPEEEEEVFQTKPLVDQITLLIQRQVEEEEEEEMLQAKSREYATPEVSNDLESQINAIKGGGRPLEESERAYFEPRFGADFSRVRVHTGAQAAESARAVNARAFTVGQDVVFGAGQYAQGASEGRRLMAHELTHVHQHQSSLNRVIINRWPPERHKQIAIDKQKKRTDDYCTPASGIPNTDCGAYEANSEWLPSAYVNNATCACQTTPNVPTANCVRKFLQVRLAATPGWVKNIALLYKSLDKPDEPIPYAKYQAFVQKFLTPRIYDDHVDAYRSCCCPSGPAPYPAWIGVTSVPLQCSVVGWSIRYFGSCHGTPGIW